MDGLGDGALALLPAMWRWKAAKGLLVAERRNGITSANDHRDLVNLKAFSSRVDASSWEAACGGAQALAPNNELPVSDSACLETAIPHGGALGLRTAGCGSLQSRRCSYCLRSLAGSEPGALVVARKSGIARTTTSAPRRPRASGGNRPRRRRGPANRSVSRLLRDKETTGVPGAGLPKFDEAVREVPRSLPDRHAAQGLLTGRSDQRSRSFRLLHFSFLTPLKGFGSAFWSRNRPVSVSRFTHRSVWGLKVWDLSLTAPRRCPSPLGGFLAI